MNDLRIFQNSEFGSIRTVEENGKILFCGKDAAKMLGYSNHKKALKDHCRSDGVTKRSLGVQTGWKNDGSPAIQSQEIAFIDEGNLYRLIARSKLPSAEKFERWVFDEVLPGIRKDGVYGDIQPIVTKCVEEVMTRIVPMIAGALEPSLNTTRGISCMSERMTQAVLLMPRKARRQSKILLLPDNIFVALVRKRINDDAIYDDIADWLRGMGYDISKGAVFRFFRSIKLMEESCGKIDILTQYNELIRIYDDGRVERMRC